MAHPALCLKAYRLPTNAAEITVSFLMSARPPPAIRLSLIWLVLIERNGAQHVIFAAKSRGRPEGRGSSHEQADRCRRLGGAVVGRPAAAADSVGAGRCAGRHAGACDRSSGDD